MITSLFNRWYLGRLPSKLSDLAKQHHIRFSYISKSYDYETLEEIVDQDDLDHDIEIGGSIYSYSRRTIDSGHLFILAKSITNHDSIRFRSRENYDCFSVLAKGGHPHGYRFVFNGQGYL